MKTFAQPKTIASMLIEPPVVAPSIEVDIGVPMLDLPTMDLPGAPSGLAAGGILDLYNGVFTPSKSEIFLWCFLSHGVNGISVNSEKKN